MTTSTDEGLWDPRLDLQWLATLARRLAQPGEDADDLVQETWLVALQQADPPRGSPRSWLAGILRNLRRMRARTDRRRQDRERAAATSEPTTPEAALEQLETLETLRAALAEIDPVDRLLVLGRYATGQSAVELGQRFEMPASTVRTRLQRARERLCEHVRSVRGVACFAPWLPRAGDAALGSSVAVAGGAAMSTATKVGLGIAVVAVLGLGAHRLAAPPRPTDLGEHAAAATEERVRAPSHPAVPAPSSASASTRAQTKANALRLKRARLRERRAERSAAVAAAAGEPDAVVDEKCNDGCIGTLSMQLALAEAISGCRDDLPPTARGKTKFRAHVIAEPDIGAVIDGVELLENTVGADFGECIVQSALLAELAEPERPIADDLVFRYTVGEPTSPASEFIAAYPDLVLASPELAALVSRAPGTMTDEEMTAFARWIDQDPAAQAAFGKWAAEEGLDLANVRIESSR